MAGKYALVGGLVALPFTTASYWQTGSTISLGPAFVGGLLVGVLHDGAADERSKAAARAGYVAALPLLWALADLSLFAVSEQTGWFRVVGIGASIAFVVLGFIVAALVAMLGTRIGDWLCAKVSRVRPTAVVQ